MICDCRKLGGRSSTVIWESGKKEKKKCFQIREEGEEERVCLVIWEIEGKGKNDMIGNTRKAKLGRQFFGEFGEIDELLKFGEKKINLRNGKKRVNLEDELS